MRGRGLLLATALIGSILAAASAAPARQGATIPVRMERGGLERSGIEALWVERYGGFLWAGIAENDLPQLEPSGVTFEAHPQARILTLPSAWFDPAVDVPAGVGTLASDRPALQLVQFHAPTRDRWLDALRAAGAQVLQPIAPFGYVLLADASQVTTIRTFPFVRWAGAFDPAYRFGDLDRAIAERPVNVTLFPTGSLASTLGRLAPIVDRFTVTARLPFMDLDAVGLEVEVEPANLDALLRFPTVYSVSPQRGPMLRDEMSDQIIASLGTPKGTVQPGYAQALQRYGVTGDGVIVAHVDSGVDGTHPDLLDRIAGCKDYFVPTTNCAVPWDELGHGTHTAGIVVATASTGGADAAGFKYGQGVAPGAELYVQNYAGVPHPPPFGYTGPGGYTKLNRDSILGGATVSANSWGPAGTPQGYDADTREFDLAPRDANLETPQHEALDYVLSIMNGNGGTSTQGSPDEGKNLLRVGGTQNRGGVPDVLCTCSAHGPALDGRRLPDVVAPGQGVISTKSPYAVPLFCGIPANAADPDSYLYASCTGTSMASPHASGASALFIEHYRDRFGVAPTPALIKAAFVNGAVDLAGGKDADGGSLGHIPDNKQGWGRLNLDNVLTGAEKSYLDHTVVLGETGQTYQATVQPVDPARPLKITLAWTDAPGHGLGGSTPAWVNDLDLRVTAGTTGYVGNSFGSPSTGWSVPGGPSDFMNNIENVYLQSAPAGPVTLEVLAANLAGDGVPGNGDDTDQDFVLVVSNGRLTGAA